MPFVNVRTAKGLLSEDDRRELHRRITDAMVAVEGHGDPAFRTYVTVLIEEYEPPAWSVQGRPLSTDAVARLRDRP